MLHSARSAFLVTALLATVAAAGPVPVARAQIAPPRADQPDMPVDHSMRRAVVDSLADQVERLYVFKEKGRDTAKALRRRLQKKEYDRITSAEELADSLTSHVRAATGDLHLRVGYRNEPIPVEDPNAGPPEAEMKRMREQGRRTNYGFEKVARLPGNVGYLDLRGFSGDPAGQATAVAAMNFLANTDALIIDLRRNGGGSPTMIATLLTYLTPEDDRVNFNNFYQRRQDSIDQFWTASYAPGPRLHGKPLWVLTSRRTFSGAEEFAYDLQNL
jgi:hypothetical protein